MSQGPGTGLGRSVTTIASLKWRLLLGGFRGSRQSRIQTGVSVVFSVVFGLVALGLLAATGRGAAIAPDLIVVLLPSVVLGVGLLSAAAGVESTIDARHLASEPLDRWNLGLGLLAAAIVGPPALLALLAGVGIVAGWTPGGFVPGAVVAAAVIGWWLALLLFSRTLANLLGAVATGRFRQFAQAAATMSALVAWLVTQLIARDTSGWDAERWAALADVARFTPPGQLGVAIARADRPGTAIVPLLLGMSWLPILVLTSVMSTEKLALSSPRPGGGGSRRSRERSIRSGAVLDRLLPSGQVATLASRTVRTKFRSPRQAVNTVTALAIGAGVFFLGPILGGDVDPRIVIIGGLLHFAVLFDGNNCFGMDGPSIWMEVAAGADARVLARGKYLSSIVVMTLPAVILPVGLAAMTGGWQWLLAGWLVAAGSVLGAAGVAIASASLAPVAMPDSPNPLAAGDTGQGCIAGAMLALSMLCLGVATIPVAALVFVASNASAPLATAAALAAPAMGALVAWAGLSVARLRLSDHEAELVQKVTPAR